MSGRTTTRSTTTSMSWLNFLSSAGADGDLVERAVDLDALEALLEVLRELLPVFALAPAHHRRQEVEPRALGQRHHPVDHLRHGLALDRQAGGRRIGDADARPQQTHVVVDLGDRADRRARILRGGLLLDGDRRRQPVDLVDIGLLHHLQELARIGREAFDVAALPLGIDRVEGERRLARARQAREHDEPVARDFEIDVLEIVLARTADRDDPAAVQVAARTVVEQVRHARLDLCASSRGAGPPPQAANSTRPHDCAGARPLSPKVVTMGATRQSPACPGRVSGHACGQVAALRPASAACSARLGCRRKKYQWRIE